MAQHLQRAPRVLPHGQLAALPLALLRQLFDAALDAVVVIDADGLVTAWNRSAADTFGWTADEAIGRRLSELIVPEHLRADHERGLHRVRHSHRSRILDRRQLMNAVHKDGRTIPVELTVTRLEMPGAEMFAGFVRDLSREAASEAARDEAEIRYRSLVERLPGIAYVNELGGESRFVSPRVEQIVGYAPSDWSFDLWRDRLHRGDRPGVLNALAAGKASGEPFTVTYRLRARDGRWLWMRDEAIVVTERDGGQSVHGVMFDITNQRATERALQAAARERRQVVESLHRLQAAATPEDTAAAICAEVMRIQYVDMASIVVFEPDGSAVPIAGLLPAKGPIAVGHPLPEARARYLRESSTGPWIDEWTPASSDDDYARAWLETGLRASAYVPFGTGGRVYGVLAAGTTARIGVDAVTRWLPSLAEYAAVAGGLLIPALVARRAAADAVSPIRRAIEETAFVPYFQPIVELESRSVVGYEALSRFADGVAPEVRFADADAVGLGQELELACLREAVVHARQLPADRWLSLNVSHGLLARLAETDLLSDGGRPLVLELTEHLEIHDYEAVRDDLRRIREPVSVAVDDAGAGFSSFRHILELHPRYVKLDMRLVRGVDRDPARQALIAGMVYFSRQTDCVLIAEGIETEGERRTLRQLGVTFGQGFLFGPPRPVEEVRTRGH